MPHIAKRQKGVRTPEQMMLNSKAHSTKMMQTAQKGPSLGLQI